MRKPCHDAQRMGMTLTEILIVVAIIGILLALVMPAANSLRSAAKSTICLGNQRQVALAAGSYAIDHRGGLPATRIATGSYWFDLVSPYLEAKKGSTPDIGFAGTAIRGCPDFKYDPSITNRFSYGINAYLRYGEGGVDSAGVSVDRLHNRIGGTSNVDYWREFRASRITKPSTRLYLGDQDAFWTGSNDATWQSTGPDIRHRGRMALTFVDGRATLGTAEEFLAAQLNP